MLTKEQIEQAAKQYCQENNGDAFEYHAFWNGAEWAAEQMRAENERLRADNHRLFEQAAALQAGNAVLRAKIEEMQKQIK